MADVGHCNHLHDLPLVRAHEHKHTVPRAIRQGINKVVDTYKGRNEHHEHRLRRREETSNTDSFQPDIRVVSVAFPDHLGRVYHFSFVEDVRLSDLRAEILQNPRAPLSPECDQLYRFFQPSTDETHECTEWLDEALLLTEIASHLYFRRLTPEQVAKVNLEDIFVYVKNPSSPDQLLVRLPRDVDQTEICKILCERMDISDLASKSYDIFRACGSQIEEKPLNQLEELEFRRKNHFLIGHAELSAQPPRYRDLLELNGDVTVREAIEALIDWLGLTDATPYSVGLIWHSPSLLLEFDPPIMHWLPLDQKLCSYQFRPHEEIVLQSVPSLYGHSKECSHAVDIQQSILFVTTPEVERTVIYATPGSFIKPRRVNLLNQETIAKSFSGVRQLQQNSLGAVEKRPRITGTLYITSYRLLLDAASNHSENDHLASVVLALPLAHISSLQVDKDNVLHIEMKNESEVLFASDGDVQQLKEDIELLAITSVKYCFAFQYDEPYLESTDGWQVFNYRTEMARQGVTTGLWRHYENHNYQVSPTYPYEFAIPATVTDELLLLSASYRSKNRVPVLSYLHHNGASICRCAQPKKGMTLKRCRDDEFLVNSIRLAAGEDAQLWVIDCRAKSKATIQRVLDGGYERNYEHCEVYFCNIQNMHAMRHSMQGLVNACNGNCETFLGGIMESKWLSHCFTILHAAQKTAQLVHSGSPVLVHCTDGWDRTPQICALAQILLDPYFRTLEGFQVLIEKDWCAFGHKFGDRLGQGSNTSNPSERSPIFAQFIDCVWQLKMQFPHEFEFNDSFLHTVRYHSTSCRFGTFLFRSDRERRRQRLRKRTISLWTFINNNLQAYRNPTYNPVVKYMQPHVAERALSVWREAYCFQSEYAVRFRYNKTLQDVENLELKQENELLKNRLRRAEHMLYSRELQKESLGARPRKGESIIPKVEVKPSVRDNNGRLVSILDESDIGDYGGDVFLSDEEDDLYLDSDEEDLDNDTSISEKTARKMDMGSA